jgi:hypothetical protein
VERAVARLLSLLLVLGLSREEAVFFQEWEEGRLLGVGGWGWVSCNTLAFVGFLLLGTTAKFGCNLGFGDGVLAGRRFRGLCAGDVRRCSSLGDRRQRIRKDEVSAIIIAAVVVERWTTTRNEIL